MVTNKAIYVPEPGFRTNTDRFREYVNEKHNLDLKDYHALHKFSVDRLNDFWMAVWQYCGIRASVQPSRALESDNPAMFPPPHFFPEARMNYAENMLCGEDHNTAVIEMNETNIHRPVKYTWKDLRTLVAKYAGVFSRLELEKGDVIVVIGGNCARSLALLLAAASIGAVFASFQTDMGEKALIGRVEQLQPKVIIAECVYQYNGRLNDITNKNFKAAQVTKCKLIISQASRDLPSGSQLLNDLVQNETDKDLHFEQVPTNQPFVVIFSSGTTGTPKGIVHGQGGLMINGIKEHLIHNNFGPKDVHFHFSGIGWTLWNISIGALFTGATMVLYDGSPFHPSPEEFLKAIFATGVTGYGGSPRYFSELQKLGVKPRKYATKMHTLLSTGALLTPGTASWLAEAFGPVCQIGFSGGTELCGNFMTGTRSLPSYPGEVAVLELGMDVVAFGTNGKPLPDGEAGELVCRKPFPNMPVKFWNDALGKRYHKSYFEGVPGVWTHGDLIRVNPDTKGIYVLGRSDGVLNPSGVRFGTSELYNILALPEFASITLEGLAIGHQRATSKYQDPSEQVILFLKVSPSHSSGSIIPKQDVVDRLKARIAQDHSRRHVPHYFFEVPDIPHNANGKKMEIQVKQVCNGGGAVLKHMTLTDAEREMLTAFVKFYDIEEILQKHKRPSKL